MFAQGKLRLLGCICFMLVFFPLWVIDAWRLSWPAFIVWVCALICMSTITFILLHVSFLIAPKYDDVKLLICRYLFMNIMEWVGAFYQKRQELDSIHCMEMQQRFLMKTLSEMAKTAYGRDHGFAKMTSVSDFRTSHPLTTYAHYRPYVERVAQGEENVVLPGKPSRIALTSGTTGRRKLIIASKKRQSVFLFKLGTVVSRVLRKRYDPGQSLLQTVCLLYVHTEPKMSEGGIPMGPISMIQIPDLLFRITFSTPPAGMRLTNERHAMYVHLLFGLRDPTLKYISAFFAPTMYSFFSLLEDEWRDLVDDIDQGKINVHLDIDADVRAALKSELVPDPKRAAELTKEFQKGFVGIARRIWPRMRYMLGISSGASVVYAKRLQATYTKGIPLISSTYNASEGTIGTLYGKDHQYIVVPGDLFYEFIPIEHSEEDQPDTLLADEVKEGQTYELAITNMDGLYRYRLGDVIKVTKFHNSAPILDFQYRSGELLNLKGEKTTEVNLRSAIVDTLAASGKVIVDYSCVESVLYEDALGHSDLRNRVYYVIFAELDDDDSTSELNVDELTSQVDTQLQADAAGYAHQRKRDAIGRLKLVIVQPGSFQALRAHILANTACASATQMKIPKKLLKAEWIQLLVDRDIENV
ncbi:uncharacterized protein LOC135154405 [Lytechinus pictus]|uniref:uncharacterized protein LOC135154405 n=1 Tax=Lytechinus pictus TaxID=7653 RepID=UPI0030BA09DC